MLSHERAGEVVHRALCVLQNCNPPPVLISLVVLAGGSQLHFSVRCLPGSTLNLEKVLDSSGPLRNLCLLAPVVQFADSLEGRDPVEVSLKQCEASNRCGCNSLTFGVQRTVSTFASGCGVWTLRLDGLPRWLPTHSTRVAELLSPLLGVVLEHALVHRETGLDVTTADNLIWRTAAHATTLDVAVQVVPELLKQDLRHSASECMELVWVPRSQTGHMKLDGVNVRLLIRSAPCDPRSPFSVVPASHWAYRVVRQKRCRVILFLIGSPAVFETELCFRTAFDSAVQATSHQTPQLTSASIQPRDPLSQATRPGFDHRDTVQTHLAYTSVQRRLFTRPWLGHRTPLHTKLLHSSSTSRLDDLRSDTHLKQSVRTSLPFPELLVVDSLHTDRRAFTSMNVIGQWNTKFILVDGGVEQGLYLIDQHALHERTRLEHFLSSPWKHVSPEPLKHPRRITFDSAVLRNDEQLNKLLQEMGWRFHSVEHDQSAVVIRAAPRLCLESQLFVYDQPEHFHDSVKAAAASVLPTWLVDALIMRSCRGAIWFGHALDPRQMSQLVSAIPLTQQFHLCSHGRPSICHVHP